VSNEGNTKRVANTLAGCRCSLSIEDEMTPDIIAAREGAPGARALTLKNGLKKEEVHCSEKEGVLPAGALDIPN
jgi:hypothetical protein